MRELEMEKGISEALWITYLPFLALLLVSVTYPVFAIVLSVASGRTFQQIDEAFALGLTSSAIYIVSNLFWHVGLCVLSRWDIRHTWPLHGVAISRLWGSVVAMSIPGLLLSFAVAEDSLLDIVPSRRGQGLGIAFELASIGTLLLGIAGIYIGWLFGLFVGYKDGQGRREERNKWKLLVIVCLASFGFYAAFYLFEQHQLAFFSTVGVFTIVLSVLLWGGRAASRDNVDIPDCDDDARDDRVASSRFEGLWKR